MNNARDPLEILTEALEAQRAALDDGPRPEVVLERLAKRNQPTRSRRHQRRIVGAVVALAVTGSAAVGWAVLHRERATQPGTVQCLRQANLNASSAVVGLDGLDPVELCTQLWEASVDDWGPLPPLVGCVSPTGVAVVMPGDANTCRTLGLVDLDPTLTDDQERVVRLQQELGQLLGTARCVPPHEAVEIAEGQRLQHDLGGWDVQLIGEFDDNAPCGTPWIDPDTETIYIQPHR